MYRSTFQEDSFVFYMIDSDLKTVFKLVIPHQNCDIERIHDSFTKTLIEAVFKVIRRLREKGNVQHWNEEEELNKLS